MAKIPLACTLSPEDAAVRLDEWSEFVDTHVEATARTATMVRLRLRNDDVSILSAVDVARREKKCCGFFEFRLLIGDGELWLEVEIPGDAGVSFDELSFLTTT
ncbi:MAG TPA: hypothetical protein VMF33_05685 [Acidimicrobiales bacterium]|nr:hypothetical protein [Acidimicrobiales bacterium]